MSTGLVFVFGSKEKIAPLFVDASRNCQFDTTWYPILGNIYNYWETFR
jgi:hypothetical protein